MRPARQRRGSFERRIVLASSVQMYVCPFGYAGYGPDNLLWDIAIDSSCVSLPISVGICPFAMNKYVRQAPTTQMHFALKVVVSRQVASHVQVATYR